MSTKYLIITCFLAPGLNCITCSRLVEVLESGQEEREMRGLPQVLLQSESREVDAYEVLA